MKILLIHNFYRSGNPGGEDNVVRQERALLERAGHEVVLYDRCNDEVDERDAVAAARTALRMGWSHRSHREVTALIRRERPDVAHVHNTFPLVTPSVYAAAREAGVPVVQTLHNYRWLCTAATFYRNDAVCEQCGPTRIGPALRHRCYRGSLIGSAAVAFAQRRAWRDGSYAHAIDAYITLSRFAAARFVAAGLDPARVHVKPNFVDDSDPPGTGDGGYVVYAGRLSTEKGLLTLLDAWRGLRDVPLRIVGDGPLLAELRARAAREGLPVEFLGLRPREEVRAVIGGAARLVLPSQWFEGLPLVLVESYARGTPVVAARIGSLAELVVPDRTGLQFRAGDASELAARVRELWADELRRGRLRRGARARFDEEYTAPRNLGLLLDVYTAAGAARK